MKAFVTMLSIAVLLGALPLSTRGQEQRSSHDQVYTTSQARAGAKVYREACGACHAPDEFVGPSYMSMWTGKSAAQLFSLIRDTMPEEAPGTLSRVETAALVAHLFRANGMPAGETEMGSDEAEMEEIRIEGPYKTE